jgi:hypothetical protein
MRRSSYRRASSVFSGRRRLVAVLATLVTFGAIVTVTQVSDAGTRRRALQRALAACENVQVPTSSQRNWSTQTRRGTYTTNRGRVTHHADDGAQAAPTRTQMRQRCRNQAMQNASQNTNAGGQQQGGQQQGGDQDGQQGGQQQGGQQQGGQQQGGQQQGGQQQGGNNNGGNNNGGNVGAGDPGAALGVLANSCEGSNLGEHDGFQAGNRCVSTQFGEVAAAGSNASLLITQAPENVNVNQAFTLQVSTRNLIRDRFLAAGQGGYYVESSLLQGGIVRGHFHTACRMLANENAAPDPAPAPAFFVATEDGRGGRNADTVNIQVAGLPQAGTAQCAVWAGDGSHRIPMMERANQTPAFDVVRVQVGNNNNNNNNGGQQGGNNNGGRNNN